MRTVDEIAHMVTLHCPLAGLMLARTWVDSTCLHLVEERDWSWRIRRSEFIFPAVYTLGAATVARGETVVSIVNGGVVTAEMVGRQFRSGTSPLYTITRYVSASQFEIDREWGGTSLAAATFQILKAYVTVPEDFQNFLTIIDPARGQQIAYGMEARQLDQDDPQRSVTGTPEMFASADYSDSYVGTVGDVLTVRGAGPAPISSETYTGAADSVFTVEITTGGASGTAAYKWKKDDGAYVTGVVTATDAAELQDGVMVTFPAETYVVGDTFVITAAVISSPGLARYEAWPHAVSAMVIPYFYLSRPPRFSEGFILPRTIPGEVILEGALGRCARWPGNGIAPEDRNPYFQIALAEAHEGAYRRQLEKLQQKDDDIYPSDVSYYRAMPFSPRFSAAYWQKHA